MQRDGNLWRAIGSFWNLSVPRSVALVLADYGHTIEMVAETAPFGKGQIILKRDDYFIAGSEPRADGLALAW